MCAVASFKACKGICIIVCYIEYIRSLAMGIELK